jgi:regulator of protease activity HflC (stomatin/prohibitin superfamily)
LKRCAESIIRTAVGEEKLENILHDRQKMNKLIQSSVEAPAANWGIKIIRCEVTVVKPADAILETMNQKVSNDIETRKQVWLSSPSFP